MILLSISISESLDTLFNLCGLIYHANFCKMMCPWSMLDEDLRLLPRLQPLYTNHEDLLCLKCSSLILAHSRNCSAKSFSSLSMKISFDWLYSLVLISQSSVMWYAFFFFSHFNAPRRRRPAWFVYLWFQPWKSLYFIFTILWFCFGSSYLAMYYLIFSLFLSSTC